MSVCLCNLPTFQSFGPERSQKGPIKLFPSVRQSVSPLSNFFEIGSLVGPRRSRKGPMVLPLLTDPWRPRAISIQPSAKSKSVTLFSENGP